MTRRTFLATVTTSVAATMGVARAQYSELDVAEGVFQHGVASGDPTPTAVIIWTRVTLPGNAPVPVTWEVATDEGFAKVEKTGVSWAVPESDFTVHVDVTELHPKTTYWYRFSVAVTGWDQPTVSRIGRTATVATSPEEITFAVTSCANIESGYFTAYGDISLRDDIDCVLHLGDYFYEYASGSYTGKNGITRPTAPAWECETLADYRTRYAHYRRDAELQAAHAAHPWVVTWDDHECANDLWAAGEAAERKTSAMQAYLEWMPIRATSPSTGGHIYRSLQFGDLAEVSMLDLRTYRGPKSRLSAGDPTRHMLGSEQFEWLTRRLSTSDARWKIIGNSVMMAPLDLIGAPVKDLLGHGMGSLPVNPDQWDGYRAERLRLLELIARTPGCVFVTGDIHSEWANELHTKGQVVAPEFICSSVTAPNVDDKLHLPTRSPVTRAMEAHLRQANSHVRHVDLDSHGYLTVTLTKELVRAQWYRVEDIETKGSPVRLAEEATWDGTAIDMTSEVKTGI